MPNYQVYGEDLTAVASAIRTAAGTSSALEFPDDFITEIGNISGGGNLKHTATISSTGNASYCYVRHNNTTTYYTSGDTFLFEEGDSLYCYVKYSGGMGNMITLNGSAVAGGTGSTSASYTYTMPAKDIRIGLTYSAMAEISIIESVIPVTYMAAQTVTPGATAKTVLATNKYFTDNITVNGDVDLVAGNIKDGVEIFGVTGTYSGGTDGYVATITHIDWTQYNSPTIQVNGTGPKYSADGTTFNFKEGDTFKIYLVGTRGGGRLKFNGDIIHNTNIDSYYEWTPPACDLDITMTTGSAGWVDITSRVLDIFANGTYEVPNSCIANVNVPNISDIADKKQINFIDYNGTILYSYTKSEWQSVTSLPGSPAHEGLISQGWNWTKAQIDAQLTAMPNGDIWVGQMYITQNGNTEIDVSMPYGRLDPILTICVSGTITVDWGDNTTPDTVTGTSTTTRQAVSHSYASEGNYTISIHTVSGNYAFYNSSSYLLLRKDTSSNTSRVYSNCIQNIRLGNGITSIGQYAFCYCASLASITIPNTVTSISSYAFYYCYSLPSVTIPNTITSFGNSTFSYCYSLSSIAIPNTITNFGNYTFNYCFSLSSVTIPNTTTSFGVETFYCCYSLASIVIPSTITTIGNSIFNSCYSLASIVIPSTVTTIGNSTFNQCSGMAEYHFLSTTIPTLGTTAFGSIPSDCIIYVPSASLSSYQSSSNWSTYSSYMVGE